MKETAETDCHASRQRERFRDSILRIGFPCSAPYFFFLSRLDLFFFRFFTESLSFGLALFLLLVVLFLFFISSFTASLNKNKQKKIPMDSLTVAAEAYIKVVMHCLKYPTQPVFGLLLGRYRCDAVDDAAKENFHGSSCLVIDMVPLFHTGVLSAPHPMVEVALELVKDALKGESESIVGVYVANERLNDLSLSPLLTPLLLSIQEAVPMNAASTKPGSLVLWMVDNAKVKLPFRQPCINSIIIKNANECPYLNGAKPVPSSGAGVMPLIFVVPARPPKNSEGDKKEKEEKVNGASNENAQLAEFKTAKNAVRLNTAPVENIHALVSSCISSHVEHHIEDFEDHLEDPTIDFIRQPIHSMYVHPDTVFNTNRKGKK